MRFFGRAVGLFFCIVIGLIHLTADAQQTDSDHDGLSDALESSLLLQFEPHLMISKYDCSDKPAQFEPGLTVPTVERQNGTLYGQAFPRSGFSDEVELHYYHLWRRDCGEMGHDLDTEHVSVLVRKDTQTPHEWHALYWYAAAHEDTVCDASQITRASTIHARNHGAIVWISAGKHASFLNHELCSHGCGGDRCTNDEELQTPPVINLGEADSPMDGATWIISKRWPLLVKMGRTDFSETRLARLNRLSQTDIAWANPAKRPEQTVIMGGNDTIKGVATGGRSTDTALVLADIKTDGALDDAAEHTGNALLHSFSSVGRALGSAGQHTGHSLGLSGEKSPQKDTPE